MKAQKGLSTLNDRCAQAVQTVRLQKLTGTHFYWVRLLKRAARRYRIQKFRVVTTSNQFALIAGMISILSISITLFHGGTLLELHTITLGEFIAFIAAISMVQAPFADLGFITAEFQRGWASLGRVITMWEEPKAHRISRNDTKIRVIHQRV